MKKLLALLLVVAAVITGLRVSQGRAGRAFHERLVRTLRRR